MQSEWPNTASVDYYKRPMRVFFFVNQLKTVVKNRLNLHVRKRPESEWLHIFNVITIKTEDRGHTYFADLVELV